MGERVNCADGSRVAPFAWGDMPRQCVNILHISFIRTHNIRFHPNDVNVFHIAVVRAKTSERDVFPDAMGQRHHLECTAFETLIHRTISLHGKTISLCIFYIIFSCFP